MKNFKLLFAFLAVTSLVVASDEPVVSAKTTWPEALGINWFQNRVTSLAESVQDRAQSVLKFVDDSVQSQEDSFHKFFTYSNAVNNKDEKTYATQAHNGFVYIARYPFDHPFKTMISAFVLYAFCAACQEYCNNDDANNDDTVKNK